MSESEQGEAHGRPSVGLDDAPLLRLDGVSKSFGAVRALEPVSLDVARGEVVGLIGENGAGKSTLIKLISGIHTPDAGRLLWMGQPVQFGSPRDALRAGIATIHQELEYFSHLTVAENVLLGERWPRKPWGAVDWRALNRQVEQMLDEFGLHISPQRFFGELTAAEKQEVSIAAALSRNARLLILDEPTASLTEPEVQRLFAHMRRLRERGVSMIYVSHRLDEIFAVTDRVAVLRDGRFVATHRTAEVEVKRLVSDMVGRPLEQVYPRTRSGSAGDVLFEAKGLTRDGMFRDVSLTLRAGEIVGLAGLVGAGRSEVARAIYGLYPTDAGETRLAGKAWKPAGAHTALAAGVVYLPEERKRQGLVLEHSVQDSISIGFSDLISRFGLVNRRAEKSRLADVLSRYAIRASNPAQPIGTLSGGNQQKALLARWLEREPRVIILDEPTRGVDVGAKAQIHATVDRLAASGKAVLFISSDLPEIVGMCDRVLVMHRGTIGAELRGGDITEHNVILAASGMYEDPRTAVRGL